MEIKKKNKTHKTKNRRYKPYIFSNYIEHKLIEYSNQKSKTVLLKCLKHF